VSSVTIRRIPDDLLDRIRAAASAHGVSLEQELRDTLAARYPTRTEVLAAVRAGWARHPAVDVTDIDGWIDEGAE